MTATNIKAILKLYNASLSEVAAHMGITYQALYDRLARKEITTSTLQGVAETIGIPLSKLFAHLEDMNNTPVDEVAMLRRENELLRQVIEEKERLIELLLGQKGELLLRRNTKK